jgi:ppGpp synthetase/RelA/SpoT-type nucleotidyltranferase
MTGLADSLLREEAQVLTRQDVEKVAARFAERRASFERVAGEVHRRTVNLLQGRALKSVVTSRAKSVESLKRSLWRDREKRSPEEFERALAPPLVDLAGVRVLLYQDADVEPARDALTEFEALRSKDKRSTDAYSAYHLVVHNWCSEDDADNRELRGIPCEIQICTIVEHVWNELEHDIKYKQPGGRPDDGQVEMLMSLRGELELCARTVRRLMARTTERLRSNDEQLVGAQDLRRYLEGRFNRRVDGPFDELWKLIYPLVDRVTPRIMDDLFDQGRPELAARELRNQLDLDAAHRDVGLVAVMLLPAFLAENVRDVIGDQPDEPLWKFILRVLASEHGGTT